MIPTAALVGVVALCALLVFFWRRNGIGSGRGYGNRVAAHIGIPKSLFHSLMAHGAPGSYRQLLASLEKAGLTLDQAGAELAPTLAKGVERMEAHFGPQETLEAVKPLVARLVSMGSSTG